MTSMTTSEQILKTDVLGPVQTPESRRQQLLDEFERNGLSGAKFAPPARRVHHLIRVETDAKRFMLP